MRGLQLLPVFAFALCLSAHGQDQKSNPQLLKIEKLSATGYRELHLNRADRGQRGVLERLDAGPKRFLNLDAVVHLLWDEKTKQVAIDLAEIVLVDDKGQAYRPVGRLENGGDFVDGKAGFVVERPSDWKEKVHAVPFSAIFLVPRTVKAFEFRLGPAAGKLLAPEKDLPCPVPAADLNVQILESKLVESARIDVKLNGENVKSTLTNPNGLLLRVRFRLAPKRGNQADGALFLWHTTWVGVVANGQNYVPAAAEDFNGTLPLGLNHQIPKPKDASPWPGHEQTFYFAVPKDTTTFKLTYMLAPVAEGKISP
ncbi:MAG: hypothetical protein AB7K24_08885 [Gemmataceae bacterium]